MYIEYIGNITIITLREKEEINLKQFIESMMKLLGSLHNHPEKDKEIAEMIKKTLNTSFDNIRCKKVFISKGSECNPYVVSVIPNIPSINILEVSNITDYDIDIDLDSFANGHNYNGLTDMEVVAWMVHELLANVITDETLIRYKKLLVRYYDTNNSTVMDVIKSLGRLLWIGIFSRTKKDYIDEEDSPSNSSVNMTLCEYGLADYWNSALAKYVCNIGGTCNILCDDYITRMDKNQLREFNRLARKYSSYVLKYNNTDYSTMIKYIISSSNSELVKYYTEKEPEQLIVFKEKDIYNIFDDRKLLLEDVEFVGNIDRVPLLRTKTAEELNSEYRDLEIDVDNIEKMSDKINLAVRIRDFVNEVSKKILEDDPYTTESLSLLREKSMNLLDKLDKIDVDEKLSVVEIDDTTQL